jgi:hypothetical protein
MQAKANPVPIMSVARMRCMHVRHPFSGCCHDNLYIHSAPSAQASRTDNLLRPILDGQALVTSQAQVLQLLPLHLVPPFPESSLDAPNNPRTRCARTPQR